MQVPELVAGIEGEQLIAADGNIKYEEWIKKYARTYFSVHKAFQGFHKETKMPMWDRVISWFETLDASRGPASECHEVSWDHFRKVLTRAGVELRSDQVTRLIDHLDTDMNGAVDWVDFVRGLGDDGDLQSAPYFFNGDMDLQMRVLMKRQWDDVLAACRRRISAVRTASPTLIPAGVKDKIPAGELAKALKESERLKLADAVREGKARENPLVSKICDVANFAFCAAEKDSRGGLLIDCERMARYYAGAAFDAETMFERK